MASPGAILACAGGSYDPAGAERAFVRRRDSRHGNACPGCPGKGGDSKGRRFLRRLHLYVGIVGFVSRFPAASVGGHRTNKIDRIDREIARTREKLTEYQNRLRELEAQKTEAENLQIVQLVRAVR